MPRTTRHLFVIAWLVMGSPLAVRAQQPPSSALSPATLQAGQNGSVQMLIGRAVTETVEETFQVMVTVQEEVVRDGRRGVVTKEVPRVRTHAIEIQVMATEQKLLPAGSFVVMNTQGQHMGSFSRWWGGSVPAVLTEVRNLANASVPAFYQKILNPQTPIVLAQASGSLQAPSRRLRNPIPRCQACCRHSLPVSRRL